jgi:hypothetical protein
MWGVGQLWKMRKLWGKCCPFPPDTDDVYDKFATNKEIEVKSDSIIDFSEKHQFGEF